MTREELVQLAIESDETRRLLLETTQVDEVGWPCCPSPGCPGKLLMCMHCYAAGCYAHAHDSSCPNLLLDRRGVCRRCDEPAGMNRVLKMGHYVLGDAWQLLRTRRT